MKCDNCPESKIISIWYPHDVESRLRGWENVRICLKTGKEAEPEICEEEEE